MVGDENTNSAGAAEPSAAVDAESFAAAQDAETTPEPAGPKRIAVIFAHPDDAEFICAGTVARWAAEGNHITYVLLTSGDKGSDDQAVTPAQLVATREAEQRAAADILGVADVVFLRYADAMLVPDLDLRRTLTRVIRQVRPDVVICQDPTVRYVGQEYLNHPDHRAAGEATLDAVYPAARDRLTFPELLAEGLEPHKVREVYLAGSENADVAIDITPYLDVKLAALRAHASQIGWDPSEMVRKWAHEEATRFPGSGDYVEAFKYFKLD
ncbi:MAG TPA: PIG-L deacetylase family protein [Thermomicrobiales bacterium]|jgi:LmbE family N-acetylglucosaminyl deacetylase|nr:PIG-L deacetylase family protein [Thermomicrobiales bacterium]